MNLFHPELIHFALHDDLVDDQDMAEVSLLLTVGQAEALEEGARRCGLTVGQVLRRLIREFLAESDRRPGR